MTRLTGWDGNRAYICNLSSFITYDDINALIYAVVERLAAYEDTGSNPNEIRSLQAEMRHGAWLEVDKRPRSSRFYCSVCYSVVYDPQPTRRKGWKKKCRYAYCPSCGAKMDVAINKN